MRGGTGRGIRPMSINADVVLARVKARKETGGKGEMSLAHHSQQTE